MNSSSLPPHRFDLSVIIPVEYHRDQAVDCVRGWAQEQEHPAERYQLILCAPMTLDPDTEGEIRALLRPWDRLEKCSGNHDMALVAEAARMAESDLLLFTESHCLPYRNAVGSMIETAADQPEWAGFSCTTTPITHNLLSEIEAQIYDTHIRQGLDSSVWMKVIDQCFVIRRAAYIEAGGFRPSFGHFAEWLLAAELHRLGKTIGLYPHDLLRHHYSGIVHDLEGFTLDFAKGHIQYLAECGNEPTASYFQEIPELQEYCRRTQVDYRQLAVMKTKALPATFMHLLRKTKQRLPRVALSAVLLDWLESALKGVSMRSAKAWAIASAYRAKRRLLHSLHKQDRAQATADFLDWFAKLAHLGRLQYLVDTPALQGSFVRNPNYPISQKLDWRAATRRDTMVEWLDLFDGEETPTGRRLRWSKPTASIWLPLHEGRQRIIIEWDETRPLPAYELLQVNFAGQPVLPHAMQLSANCLILEIEVGAKAWHQLEWTVTPFLANHDRRLLGLPVTSIHWFSPQQSVRPLPSSPPAQLLVEPVYFLHVTKSAGTSLQLVLGNACHSSESLAPYGGRYSPEDLAGIQAEPLYAFYRGHFRWALPSLLPGQNWKVVTVLRDPVDRILSLFYYLKQHGHVPANTAFAQWVEHDISFDNTMASHFLPPDEQPFGKGGDTVRQASLALLTAAQANLQTCLAVGLFERLEDSVNLFAWHLGFLAPKNLPKNNPSQERASVDEIPDTLRARLERVLEADMALYRQAQQQFQSAMAAMLAAVGPVLQDKADTATVRDKLRQDYLDRMILAGRTGALPARIDWSPDDVFHGENLHPRELCAGRCLRWTGPNATTSFYFYLGSPRAWTMTIVLHPATPIEHAAAAQLSLNGKNIPVQITALPSGEKQLVAHLTKAQLMHSLQGVVDFALTTLLVRGEQEFRMLGVAIVGISFSLTEQEPIGSDVNGQMEPAQPDIA